MSVRVRFAPSPTGFLHIGGVRTALFNWLYAKRHGGKFLLRIEDTDLERSETKYTDDILASLTWLGLTWDEEVVFQSQRLNVYRERAEALIRDDLAYRCICTEAEVEAMRQKAMQEGKKPMYDRTCRDKDLEVESGKPFVIRAKTPLKGAVSFVDLIHGEITVQNAELDDFVLVRSNGATTYNFSVVIDDVDMRMTHIIRGDDHINNTPKQVHLYQFFGYPVPKFAHIPMILGEDKKKLSKRHGAVSANVYRGEGYLPEAILNFMVRLGWSHGDQEVFSIQEMIDAFDFDHVQKSSAVFNTEKLLWISGHHIRSSKPERLIEVLKADYADLFVNGSLQGLSTDYGRVVVAMAAQKCKTMKELADLLVPLCMEGSVMVDAGGLKWNKDAGIKSATQAAIRSMRDIFVSRLNGHATLLAAGVNHSEVEAIVKQVAETSGVKLSDLMQPVRLYVSGRMNSVGMFELLPLMAWSTLEARLNQAISH